MENIIDLKDWAADMLEIEGFPYTEITLEYFASQCVDCGFGIYEEDTIYTTTEELEEYIIELCEILFSSSFHLN